MPPERNLGLYQIFQHVPQDITRQYCVTEKFSVISQSKINITSGNLFQIKIPHAIRESHASYILCQFKLLWFGQTNIMYLVQSMAK